MKNFFWIVDLIIPVTLIVIGLIYKNNHPKQINQISGYRTSGSMKSQEAWDYANYRGGQLYIITGVILLVTIIISKLFIPIRAEYLSLIHAGIGISFMFIPVIIIEKELKIKFDENGIPK